MHKIEKNFSKFFSKYEIWNFDEIERFSFENIKEYQNFCESLDLDELNDPSGNEENETNIENEKSLGTGIIILRNVLKLYLVLEENSPFFLKNIFGSDKKNKIQPNIENKTVKNDGIKSIDNKFSNIQIGDDIKIKIQLNIEDKTVKNDDNEFSNIQISRMEDNEFENSNSEVINSNEFKQNSEEITANELKQNSEEINSNEFKENTK